MKNPIRSLKAFTIGVNCPKDQQKRVNRNSNIFLIFLIIIIGVLGVMIPTLIIGSETTLILKNDDNVLGVRSGKVLTREELPQQPFYTYDRNGTVYSITSDNISTAYVRTIGFMIIEQPFIEAIYQTPKLYTELIGFAMLKLAPLLQVGSVDNLNTLPSLEIYSYLREYPIIMVIGNFEDTYTHDIVFKITTNKYYIPLFEVEYVTFPPVKRLYNVGGWVQFSNLDTLKTKRGVWEINIDTLSYNYETSEYFAKDQLQNIGENDLPPISIEGTIVKSNSFWYIFVPITRYSTTSSSGLI